MCTLAKVFCVVRRQTAPAQVPDDLNGDPAGNVTFEEQLRAQELHAIFYAKARRRLEEQRKAGATKPAGKQHVMKNIEGAIPKASPPSCLPGASAHPWPVLKLKLRG